MDKGYIGELFKKKIVFGERWNFIIGLGGG